MLTTELKKLRDYLDYLIQLADAAPQQPLTPEEIEIILQAPAPDDALDEDTTAPIMPLLAPTRPPTMLPLTLPVA